MNILNCYEDYCNSITPDFPTATKITPVIAKSSSKRQRKKSTSSSRMYTTTLSATTNNNFDFSNLDGLNSNAENKLTYSFFSTTISVMISIT